MSKRKDEILSRVVPISAEKAAQDNAQLEKFKSAYNGKRDELIQKAVAQPQQMSFLPSQLCRTTIFYPLPRRGRKALQADPIKLEFKTEDWGSIKYYGMRLSVDDEDLLLVCLLLAKKHKAKTFLTTFTELQKLLKMVPNQKYNQRFKDAFERLGVASFSTQYKGKDDMWNVGHIMSVKGYKRKLLITFDDDFYKEFLESYTVMSLPFRMNLRGDLSKLLFTFLSSHRTPVKYHTHKLAEALNMAPDQKKKHRVQALKKAFKELQGRGFLIRYSYDSKQDVFTLQSIEKKKWKTLKQGQCYLLPTKSRFYVTFCRPQCYLLPTFSASFILKSTSWTAYSLFIVSYSHKSLSLRIFKTLQKPSPLPLQTALILKAKENIEKFFKKKELTAF